MNAEEEFVIKLTCVHCTVADLWDAKFNSPLVSFHDVVNLYFHCTEDVYLTDQDLIIKKGRDFKFASSSLNRIPVEIEMRFIR